LEHNLETSLEVEALADFVICPEVAKIESTSRERDPYGSECDDGDDDE